MKLGFVDSKHAVRAAGGSDDDVESRYRHLRRNELLKRFGYACPERAGRKSGSRLWKSSRKVLSTRNCELLAVIAERKAVSLDELGQTTGRSKSRVLRVLRTMESYGLVWLKRNRHGEIIPKLRYDRVVLELRIGRPKEPVGDCYRPSSWAVWISESG